MSTAYAPDRRAPDRPAPPAPAPRPLAIELRRTGARLVALVIAGLGLVLVVTEALPLPTRGGWTSTWLGGLSWLDNTNNLWGALVLTFGAWVGGRERRNGTSELLAVTARPAWQRELLTWAAVVGGVLAGYLVLVAAVLAAVQPVVSYGGGRWQASFALLVLGIVVCATLGHALGRLVPGRLTAPAVGMIGYGLIAYSAFIGDGRRLMPVTAWRASDGAQYSTTVLALTATWLLGVLAAALLLAVARRRVTALLPLALAVAAAVPLLAVDLLDEPDRAAEQHVCTQDAGPQVCVQRVNAGLLADVAPLVRQELARVQDIATWGSAREPVVGQRQAADVLVLPPLQGESQPFRTGLADPDRFLERVLGDAAYSSCGLESPPAAAAADAVASGLLGRPGAGLDDPAAQALLTRLGTDRAAARAWLREYLAAAPTCDLPVLQRLATAGVA